MCHLFMVHVGDDPRSRSKPNLQNPGALVTQSNTSFLTPSKMFTRYGAAAATPRGPPPPAGMGGTPVPIEWGEEARVKARQRQRRLHMLSVEGKELAAAANEGGGGSNGGAGGRDSSSMSRVPWLLLDELDAEKQKLMVSSCRHCVCKAIFVESTKRRK